MAKGNIAKNEVIKRIAEAFGEDYIGEFDKKIYVNAEENGEKIQIAITLTCPKTPVAIARTAVDESGDWDFEDSKPLVYSQSSGSTEITEEERKNIADLMLKLGL